MTMRATRTTLPRRERAFVGLRTARERQDWPDCARHLFEVLFGAPVDLQVAVAQVMLRRYLPVLGTRGDQSRATRLIDDPEGWLSAHHDATPDDVAAYNPADAAFHLAADGLLLACSSKGSPDLVTSACAFSVTQAIEARAINVWVADDPEAAAAWGRLATELAGETAARDLETLAGRTAGQNVAATAVRRREWDEVIAWLSAGGLVTVPDADAGELDRSLREWTSRDMCPLTREGRLGALE